MINLKDNNISVVDAKALGKVLSDFKLIKEVDLSNTQIGSAQSKEIADGLMRAKQIEILKLRDNA